MKNGVFRMLRCVALVRTDVSEELSTSFIRVTRIGEVGIKLAVTSNRRTLRINTKSVGILLWLLEGDKRKRSWVEDVIDFFDSHNPSSRAMVPGTTKFLIENIVRTLPGVERMVGV
jgi:hypothetical protein